MAVDIGPKIGIDGEKEFRRELGNINQQLKTMGSELKRAASAAEAGADADKSLAEQKKILQKQIEKQNEKIRQLTKGLSDSAKKYGENDSKTQRWAQAVADAETELNRMKGQLSRVTAEMDDLGEETEDAGGIFGKFKQQMGEGGLAGMLTKGFAVGSVVTGVKELGSAIMGVVTETQEYRKIMASLEVSSQRAGYTAEQTSATYTQLYGVLGEQQAAATATANLQAMGLSQEKLTEMTNAAIGAWATYGDSIPIDSMAEAINLGVMQGEVSSALSDTLKWAGVNEEEFKAKLDAANSSTERADIILQQLADLGLAKAGEAWRQNNQDIVKVNEATANYDAAVARLGETLAPVAAGLINFAAAGIGAVIDAFKDAVQWCKDFVGWLKKANAAPRPTGLAADAAAGRSVDGSHAGGLSYVPFDGYHAILHKGEAVLTAKENSTLRSAMIRGAGAALQAAGSAGTSRLGGVGFVGGEVVPITIVVESILNGDKVARSVTKTQAELKKAGGLA